MVADDRHIIQTMFYVARQLSALAEIKRSRWQEHGAFILSLSPRGLLLCLSFPRLLPIRAPHERAMAGLRSGSWNLDNGRSLFHPLLCCSPSLVFLSYTQA